MLRIVDERCVVHPISSAREASLSGSDNAGRLRDARSDAASFRALLGARTPISPRQASDALRHAYRAVLGREPSAAALSVLWAQWALETGRGRAMAGYNFGGLKGRSPDGGSALLATREGFGASERQTEARFRTYASPAAGARDYVKTLAERYPEALAAATTGDAHRFVAELGRAHYFTGDPHAYRRAVVSLTAEHQRVGPSEGPSAEGPSALPRVSEAHPALDSLLWMLGQLALRRS
jgi:hypothetical protein